MDDQLIAWTANTHFNTKHRRTDISCLQWGSKPRSQCWKWRSHFVSEARVTTMAMASQYWISLARLWGTKMGPISAWLRWKAASPAPLAQDVRQFYAKQMGSASAGPLWGKLDSASAPALSVHSTEPFSACITCPWDRCFHNAFTEKRMATVTYIREWGEQPSCRSSRNFKELPSILTAETGHLRSYAHTCIPASYYARLS